MKDCIFCAIINKEKDTEFIRDDEHIVVFKDVHPKAPIHFLIVPRKHITSVNELEEIDRELIGTMIINIFAYIFAHCI